nr:hypothetical protein [Tanacetum cinerariifolium]
GSGVVGGGDSGWSSDEWRWCSGGAGCCKAVAVGMVTGGSGVLMVAVGGLDRSGDGEQSWGSRKIFAEKISGGDGWPEVVAGRRLLVVGRERKYE